MYNNFMFMTRPLFLLLVIVSFAFSCKKNAVDPDASFSCQVDGKLWNPYSNDFKAPEIRYYFGKNYKYLFINARNTSTGESITLIVTPPDSTFRVGKYELNSDRYMVGSMWKGQKDFTTSPDYTGFVEILSIDKVNRKISGKFEFACYNNEVKEEIKVTNGVFNLSHYTVL